MLSSQGRPIITACDGAQARAHVQLHSPGLIVLDLGLPDVSGLELIAEWRAHPRTADLPILVVTGRDLCKEDQDYLRRHAESFFYKRHSWHDELARELNRIGSLGPPQKI